MTHAHTSRREVREKLEEHLDRAQPTEEKAKSWGREMTRAQWNALKQRKRKAEG